MNDQNNKPVEKHKPNQTVASLCCQIVASRANKELESYDCVGILVKNGWFTNFLHVTINYCCFVQLYGNEHKGASFNGWKKHLQTTSRMDGVLRFAIEWFKGNNRVKTTIKP